MIADSTLKEWIKWDSNRSLNVYAARMARRGWGGGIECAAFSHLYNVNVHVYERNSESSGFSRISCFDTENPKQAHTVNVLYCDNMHYNSLVINEPKGFDWLPGFRLLKSLCSWWKK